VQLLAMRATAWQLEAAGRRFRGFGTRAQIASDEGGLRACGSGVVAFAPCRSRFLPLQEARRPISVSRDERRRNCACSSSSSSSKRSWSLYGLSGVLTAAGAMLVIGQSLQVYPDRRGMASAAGSEKSGKLTQDSSQKTFCKSVSVYATRGPRKSMEDEYFISDDSRFFGVYDGHGGANVSKYVRKNLFNRFVEFDAQEETTGPEDALKKAFASVSKEVLETPGFDMEGSTAVTVLLDEDKIWTANLGDSRAVLCRDGKAVNLTEDHKPNSPAEKKRIEDLGGNVRWFGYLDPDRQPVQGMGAYRINENLAVSRAFGDRLETPFVSDEPEIREFKRKRDKDRFIIIASDGLWDCLSSQDAVKFAKSILAGSVGALVQGQKITRRPSRSLTKWMRKYSDDTDMVRAVLDTRKSKMAKYLVEEATRLGTSDNVSVVVIFF